MRFVLYTNSVSPHQVPFVSELGKLISEDECRYIYTDQMTSERRKLGWSDYGRPWIVQLNDKQRDAYETLYTDGLLMSGVRDVALFAQRAK